MSTAAHGLFFATAVAIDGQAALILGPSGSGKSDLALRLLTTPFLIGGRQIGVDLIADDQVVLEREAGRLFASPPSTIAGQLEVRGLGIVPFAYVARAEVRLVVSIAPGPAIERMPAAGITEILLDVPIALVRLAAFEASTPAKLVAAVIQRGA